MTRRFALVLRALALPAALLVLAAPVASPHAAAASPRAFAGSYQLLNVVDNDGRVSMTMKLTLMNRSNEDVKGGIVAILDSEPNPVLLSSFTTIKTLPHMNQVTVSHNFSVSAAEYTAWKSGHSPRLQFLVPDGDSATAEDIQAHQIVLPVAKTD